MDIFVLRLCQLIEESGLTQKEIYEKLNLSKNQLHYWKKGKAEPDLEQLKLLCNFFDVTADYLLGLEDEFGNKEEDSNYITPRNIDMFYATIPGRTGSIQHVAIPTKEMDIIEKSLDKKFKEKRRKK